MQISRVSLPLIKENHIMATRTHELSSQVHKETSTEKISKAKLEENVTDNREHRIGRGIYGQNSYPVSQKTTPELWQWLGAIWTTGKEEGLDPFDTNFWVQKRDTLLSTAARNGFPVMYRHWSFGQAYQELLLPQKHGLANLYELVINNDPSYAYLLEENPLYAQKLVMAHVMGHSDFFKNNYMFSGTFRKMLNRMGEHAASIHRILDNHSVPFEEMERFIDKYQSIKWLIDMNSLTPRELNFSTNHTKEIEKVPENWGIVDVSGLPPHMQKRFNEYERIEKERKEEEALREKRLRKIPPEPERDVLGFLIEHSHSLKPWQRHVLTLLREESYYFAPQLQTKIMNEGWASYWHMNLMKHKELVDFENTTNIGAMIGRVFALPRFNINPYTLGYEIFKDIEERWNKGQHGPEWEAITDMGERKKYDNKDMKGREKIFEVRRNYNDIEFIRTFFTQEVATRLKMYTWDPDFKEDDAKEGDMLMISSRVFEEIRKRLLDSLENGGQPIIQVVDGNFENRGELLLEHVHSYDLKQDWAEETLKNIKELWGGPIHLNTYKTFGDIASEKDLDQPFPKITKVKKRMRVSILNDKSTSNPAKSIVKRYILKENGETDYECDSRGKRLEEKKPIWFGGF